MRKLIVAAFCALLVAAVPAVATAAPDAPGGAAGVDVPRLDWADCGDGVQCATAVVPLDYRRPHGPTIALAAYRVPAADPAHRIGSLFINPGGPGGTTKKLVRSYGHTGPLELRQRFDIVSFDPRGVGESSAITCRTPQEYRDAWDGATARPAPGGYDRAVAGAEDFDESCYARSGKILPHTGAENFARDLDVLRAAVGDQKVSYLGISYGTFLGTVYANLFPRHIRVLSLDGAYDPESYANRPYDYDRGQYRALDAGLSRFFDWCAGAPAACGFGDGHPVASFLSLQRELDRNPVRDQQGAFVANAATMAVELSFAVNRGKKNWPKLGTDLKAAQGRGGPLLAPFEDSTVAMLNANTAVECADRVFPGGLRPLRAKLAANVRRGPLLGPALGYGPPSYDHSHATACTQWQAPRLSRYAGPWNAAGSPPILVTGTVGDPDTPFEDAVTLSRTFDNARLLVFAGEGHSAMRRSACATEHEVRYLVDKALPPKGTVCADEPQPTG
ncbi:alpha/beta fold hydrolase [Amycolatopsis sp. CA-230715]|uniref:alpha/beta fold hydrolase n=1 Tax=Amycolatopsis sp. CA-230715 TaxID=2745196 RepID=UPI001C032104|nr:alpha/beta fold hydrolase [Amycolatopsis sp. CA-230715]QWF77435.1 Tripeptidyl aminopeptidase [Amycolatopsis sp. CA-230715]